MKVIYSRSLGLSLLALFLFSFGLHAVSGMHARNAEAAMHGGAPIGLFGYLGSSQFWFESLQNWQSEFLSVGVLVVLGIFLRHKGWPESKPVDAAHSETG